jgi:Mg2+/Co2+ transporter CorC
MQSRNELDQVVNTEVFENNDELKAKFAEVIEKSESLGAVSHAIGELPSKGSTVDILGLRYEVKFVDGKHGELRLKLVSPA